MDHQCERPPTGWVLYPVSLTILSLYLVQPSSGPDSMPSGLGIEDGLLSQEQCGDMWRHTTFHIQAEKKARAPPSKDGVCICGNCGHASHHGNPNLILFKVALCIPVPSSHAMRCSLFRLDVGKELRRPQSLPRWENPKKEVTSYVTNLDPSWTILLKKNQTISTVLVHSDLRSRTSRHQTLHLGRSLHSSATVRKVAIFRALLGFSEAKGWRSGRGKPSRSKCPPTSRGSLG